MLKNNLLNKLGTGFGLGILLSAIAGFNSVSMAQSNSNDDGYQSNEKSGIFGDAPSGLDPLELMHRAQQMNGRSPAEFNAESQGQLDNSVSDFKRLQQQRILEQQQQKEVEMQVKPAATPQDTVQ